MPEHCSDRDYRGLELTIARVVSESWGLKLEVHPTSDGDWWGRQVPEGSNNFTGKVILLKLTF